MLKICLFTAAAALTAGAAAAQGGAAPANPAAAAVEAPLAIAVPPMPAATNANTPAGPTYVIGRDIATVIASDLRLSGVFRPIGPENIRTYSFPEATAPAFQEWRATGARALVSGFVELRSDGRLTVGCYLYDVTARRELARQGFVVPPAEWRRAAHKCADAVYSRVTGQEGVFDTRIVYVAESGPKRTRVKRIAMMDADGANHSYLTQGAVTVVSPRLSPDGSRVAYVSYQGGSPRVWVLDLASGQERLLVPNAPMSFAPRFSSDGRQILFSMAQGGNTNIYVAGADGLSPPRQLTNTPGIDTSPSFSPDGSRIVFESDRSGDQQLYVMNADGSDQRRISFGGGRYGSPTWSPKGDLIAFTRISGDALRIGFMSPNGSDERSLTSGWQDEDPSWASNGQFIIFSRVDRSTGRPSLYTVPISGGPEQRLATPQDGSEPAWSPVQE